MAIYFENQEVLNIHMGGTHIQEVTVNGVKVAALPEVVSQPQGGTITTKQTLTLTAGVETLGSSVSYQWYLNNGEVSGANSSSYVFVPPAAGNYSIKCRATSFGGFTETQVAGVTVNQAQLAWTNVSTFVASSVPFLVKAGNNLLLLSRNSAYSTDGGVTWVALPEGLGTGVPSFQASPRGVASDGNTVVVVYEGGYNTKSTNGGVSWTSLPRFYFSGTSAVNINCVAVSGNTIVQAGSVGYARRSTDGGSTWSDLPRGLGMRTDGTITKMHGRGNVIVAGNSETQGSDPTTLTISTDGGATWTGKDIGSPDGLGSRLAMMCHVVDNSVVIYGMQMHTAISRNGGSTWTWLPSGLNAGSGSSNLSMLCMDSVGDTIVAGTYNGSAAVSYDKGLSWSAVPTKGLGTGRTGDAVFTMCAFPDGRFFAGLGSSTAYVGKGQ
ncbi:outer capsid protein [Vibrio phage phiVC8]|uniref:Outer capsid protein n=1 Tax=Vibrio phage phiVC8 TaxID=1076759 RepID=G3FFN0_BPVC8|nr:outer capsid protein [Vibrio phage phiVC8]AEM62918.1 outer capsid protein [Vibrio phage phiVC8]